MRFNEAFRNQQVAVQRCLMDPELCAGRKRADKCMLILFECLVDDDLLVIDDLVTEHPALFFLRRRTVKTGCDQDRDIGIRVPLADLF